MSSKTVFHDSVKILPFAYTAFGFVADKALETLGNMPPADIRAIVDSTPAAFWIGLLSRLKTGSPERLALFDHLVGRMPSMAKNESASLAKVSLVGLDRSEVVLILSADKSSLVRAASPDTMSEWMDGLGAIVDGLPALPPGTEPWFAGALASMGATLRDLEDYTGNPDTSGLIVGCISHLEAEELAASAGRRVPADDGRKNASDAGRPSI